MGTEGKLVKCDFISVYILHTVGCSNKKSIIWICRDQLVVTDLANQQKLIKSRQKYAHVITFVLST